MCPGPQYSEVNSFPSCLIHPRISQEATMGTSLLEVWPQHEAGLTTQWEDAFLKNISRVNGGSGAVVFHFAQNRGSHNFNVR